MMESRVGIMPNNWQHWSGRLGFCLRIWDAKPARLAMWDLNVADTVNCVLASITCVTCPGPGDQVDTMANQTLEGFSVAQTDCSQLQCAALAYVQLQISLHWFQQVHTAKHHEILLWTSLPDELPCSPASLLSAQFSQGPTITPAAFLQQPLHLPCIPCANLFSSAPFAGTCLSRACMIMFSNCDNG